MVERERLREEAMKEYEREKGQVESVIHQMIEEDKEMVKLTKMKQDQSKNDMVESLIRKKEKMEVENQRELFENE